ncbi:MAG: DUF1749 domain-containing protein [Lachnospiraceae bacterium]|nr:DUF1749 domain-containing protein [Lachnospiraceae bacterium]
MMFRLDVPTARGVVLNGVLFRKQREKSSDTVMIAITGIHGNFYSNPFYYNVGDTLNAGGIDFIYAQTNDAFGQIETINVNTGKKEVIGSWNERFAYTDEDIEAYLTFVEQEGYEHIILAGHSLGANKVIYYLSMHHDPRIEHFFFLSPANLTYMMSGVTDREKQSIKEQVNRGDGDRMLPFPFMGWGIASPTQPMTGSSLGFSTTCIPQEMETSHRRKRSRIQALCWSGHMITSQMATRLSFCGI